MNSEILIVRNLSKSYRTVSAVQDLSFTIMRGEIFGLLGPNGAGKSTTLAILAGLLPPSTGQITLDGLDLSKNLTTAKARIGLVPQDIALYPTLSARDNLVFWGRIYGLRGKELQKRIDEVLEIVQLTDRANELVNVYSGGMKRRINLAIGLLHQPEILFLDEPTVGVDPQSRNAIFKAVEALNHAGLTVIYTTHYMEEAERLCQRVAIIDHGQIIAMDTPANLVRSQGLSVIRLSILDGLIGSVEQQVRELPMVREVNRQDHTLNIHVQDAQKTLMEVLQITRGLSAQVTALEILNASLETVFLNLTGKNLRE